MTTQSRPDNVRAGQQRLERLYAEHGRAVLAYAVRRALDEQDAADVVAQTFLVAWRRSMTCLAGIRRDCGCTLSRVGYSPTSSAASDDGNGWHPNSATN